MKGVARLGWLEGLGRLQPAVHLGEHDQHDDRADHVDHQNDQYACLLSHMNAATEKMPDQIKNEAP
jgi:hypothetical protein